MSHKTIILSILVFCLTQIKCEEWNNDVERTIASLLNISDQLIPKQLGWPSIYKELNYHLVDSVEDVDLDKNFKAGSDWLSERIDEQLYNSISRKQYEDSLYLWNGLKSLNETCGPSIMNIILGIRMATKPVIVVSSKEIETLKAPTGIHLSNRVDEIVDVVLKSNLNRCAKTYDNLLADAMKNATSQILKPLNLMSNQSTERTRREFPSTLSDENIRVFGILEALVANTPSKVYLRKISDELGGWSVNNKKLRKIVLTNLIEPCEWLITKLGSDVFLPTIVSSNAISGVELPSKLMTHIKTFKFCSHITIDKENYITAMGKYAEALSEREYDTECRRIEQSRYYG